MASLRCALLPLAVLTVALPASAKDTADPLVGAWELERYVDTPDGGGPVHAFGDPPAGLFVFTNDGHVSISIMRNPPAIDTPTEDRDPDACLPAWYCSYFGTYRYDAARSSWTAHVLGGNIPSYVGTDQTRHFAIDGNVMTISEIYEVDGTVFRAERVLKRVHRR